MLGLVTGPVGEAFGFDAVKGAVAGIGLGAGVCVGGLAVPFEGEAAVEVEAAAEAEACLLAVLAPEAVSLPGVGVAVGVDGWEEDPVEVCKKASDGRVFTVAGDERVCDVVDGAGGDPFAGVDAAGDEDGFAGGGRGFVVGGVHADLQGVDGAAFVALTNAYEADVSGEEGCHKAHPWLNDGQRLVVGKEKVVLGALRTQGRAKGVVSGGVG